MSVPTYAQFIDPLLRVLREHGSPMRAGEAKLATADRIGLTEEQRAEMLPSGAHARYAHRIGWAQDSTKRQGLTRSPSWGMWELTELGEELVVAHPEGLPKEEVHRIAHSDRRTPIADLLGQDAPSAPPTDAEPPSESPEERVEQALLELREAVANDLIERIIQSPPVFFESLVLDLLHALGYGTSRSDLQRVGGSGDAGIDGVISLDKLGLEKVYVQAKRWQGSVGRPDLQAFYGAIAGQRAKKGVFITCSHYTREALDFARSVSDTIVVIDGARLTEPMIDYRIGVTHKPLTWPRIDADYFQD